MDAYKISVIIPVYNMKAYLPRAMQSLHEQTIGFDQLQVLMIDDCSTDGSYELIQAYAEQYPNVEAYTTEENTGAAGEPRNIGMAHAQAPFLMFLDPDDWFTPRACEFLYARMKEDDADIVGGIYRFQRETEDTSEPWFSPESKQVFDLPTQLMDALKNRLAMWTKIYSRELIEREHIRFFPSIYGQDTLFLCECLSKARRYTLYGVCIYNYRVNPQSATNVQGKTFFRKHIAEMEKVKEILADYPDEAHWLMGNLSTYYIQKCIEFTQLGKQELIEILAEYRELFIHEGDSVKENVVSALVESHREGIAVSYILKEREERSALQSELQQNEKALQEKESKILAVEEQCRELQKYSRQIDHELRMANANLKHIYDSDMYKLSLKYYKLRDALFPQNSGIRKGIKNLFIRIKQKNKGKPQIKNQIEQFHTYGRFKRMDILTTRHTLFVARLLQQQLIQLKIQCRILIDEPEKYEDIPYIIVCPQFIQKFPNVYFVFQMEQTVSSRWFTKEYFVKLQNSCAILDYSLQNIEFFHKPENMDVRSRVYYLPIDYYKDYVQSDQKCKKEYDVLFYGDVNQCERRQKMLAELEKHFNVKVCSEVFGEELYREIEKARVVVNIHYYEDALLETTRLYEALSLNTCLIVSERSKDTTEEKRLENIVDFFGIDDIDDMVKRVEYWVTHEQERNEKIRENRRILEERPNAFSFFFKRFLLAYDRITFDEFYQTEKDFVTLDTNRLCLSLPESTARRRSFDQDNHYGFQCIPGLRHEKGWVGCGLSYKFIFSKALECGMNNVMICEDDVIFPDSFEEKLEQIAKELEERSDWSVFSGVMADVGRVKVSDCVKDENGYLLKIDHMVSMVFNMYNREMFKLFQEWDEQNRDVHKNAIDRYLESKDLGVYVKLPFLVGHKEELDSTIWGFSNVEYSTLIENCEKKLIEMAQSYAQCHREFKNDKDNEIE